MMRVVVYLVLLNLSVTKSYCNKGIPITRSIQINADKYISTRSSVVSSPWSVIGKLRSSPKDFFGEPKIRTSFVIKEFSQQEDLKEIVNLASQPLPSRPEGIVTIAKYTSATREDCMATEGQYERLARDNPASLFLRCFSEYQNAEILIAAANVSTLPTYDIFYSGERIARVEGNDIPKVEELLGNYQLLNSELDLFSEEADNKRRLAWEEGKSNTYAGGTPRTTAAFIPGYDWNLEGGAFDEAAKKAEESFEDAYENWLPNINDE